MRLCGNFGFNRLIFLLSLLLFSAFSHAAPICASWSTIGRNSCIINGNCQDKDGGESVTTSCDLSDFTPQKATCGDKSKKHNKVLTRMDKTGITITYAWHERGSFHDGYFQADDQINFKVPQQFAPPLLSAIKKALSQNNCIAAKDLMNGANNGHLCEGGAYCFENTNDDGTKNQCGIMTDGTSRCKISDGKTEETNPDGTPKINIDCPAGQDCRRETDLDGYASQQDNKKDKGETGDNGTREIKGESGQTGTGSDDTNKSGGQGSAGSNGNQNNNGNESKGEGSNSGTGGNGKTTNQAGIGDGSGTGNGGGGLGTGNGKGKGNGDGEGDGNGFPELAEFDLNKAIQDAKENLTNKLSLDGISLSGGSCPTFNVSVFGASHSVDIHCQILDKNGGAISAAFMFIWGFAAVRIFLSA